MHQSFDHPTRLRSPRGPRALARWLGALIPLFPLCLACLLVIWCAPTAKAALWIIVLDPDDAPPKGVRGVMVVNHASTLRQREPAQRLLHALGDLGLLDKKAQAWSELALALGMDDNTAFDELLGRRAVAVFGDSTKSGSETWALVSSTLPMVADQLEKKLDPAPRGIEDGQSMMLLERGRFRLVRVRSGDKDPETHRLVLTPFDEPLPLATALDACPSSWANSKADFLGFWRIKPDATRKPDDKRAPEPDRTFAVEATQVDQGWTASLSGSAPLFGLTEPQCKARSAGGRPVVTHDPRTLMAFEGVIPPGLESGNDAQIASLKLALSLMKIPMPEPGLWGPGVVMRVERALDKPGDIVVTIAVEVSDVAKSGAQGDALISGMLSLSAQLAGAGDQGASQANKMKAEIEKVKGDCEALRLCTLEGQHPGGATLCWTTVVARPYPVNGPPHGWWVVQFRPGAGARERAESELRSLGKRLIDQPKASKLFGFVMRPADLFSTIEPDAGARPGASAEIPWLRALAGVEQFEATAWAGASGRVEGEASVLLKPVVEPKKANGSTGGK